MIIADEFFRIGQNALLTKLIENSDASRDDYGILNRFLSTPAVIDMAIRASINVIDQYLPDDYVSVGTSTTFTHTAGSILGMTAVVKATIINLEGNEITLQIEAWDQAGPIGEGIHTRRLVHREKLYQKAEERAQLLFNKRI